MKLKFKKQAYQTNAVDAVADCFAGQPKREGLNYRVDPGRAVDAGGQAVAALETVGFKNADLALTPVQLLENIHAVQRRQNLPLSAALVKTKVCDINLDVEMETGTGKTYCYVKSMFELNARYGWSKFIVVVPSIGIS
jgi:type III restriction enzyme